MQLTQARVKMCIHLYFLPVLQETSGYYLGEVLLVMGGCQQFPCNNLLNV